MKNNARISDLKAWIYKKIKFSTERNPKRHFINVAVFYILSLILISLVFIKMIPSEIRILILSFLLVLQVILFAVDTIHLRIIRNYEIELERRIYLISQIISLEKNVYKVKSRREVFDIETDGDCTYTREMLLEYQGVDVAWAEMLLGSTTNYGTEFNDMLMQVFAYPEPVIPLSRVPIETTNSRMRFAIILRDKLSSTHPFEGYRISMKWKNVWQSLFELYHDNGILRIDYETEECILEMRLPHGYSFTKFQMPRTSGNLSFETLEDGRSNLIYKINNLSKGDSYNYFIEIKQE